MYIYICVCVYLLLVHTAVHVDNIYIYIYIYVVQFDGDSNLVIYFGGEYYSVSSEDILHAFLEVAEQQMWNYSSYSEDKIKG